MSGFDPASIAQSQDVDLSERDQKTLRTVCARLHELGGPDGSDEAFAYLDDTIAALEEAGQARGSKLLRGALYFLRAEMMLDRGEFDQAGEDIEVALDAGWRIAQAFDVAGWVQYVDDRPAAARDFFNRALSRNPDLVSSLRGRALALVELDELDHARSDLTHALTLDAQDAELYALRSDVFVRLLQLEQAERDIRQARERDADPEYALQYARLLLIQGRNTKAARVIEQALEADSSLEALLLRSHLHLTNARLGPARADAIRASNIYADDAFAFVQLAHIQLAAKKTAQALKAAERAVQLDPSLSDAYLVRGAARHLSGQIAGAREDFERAQQAPAELPHLLLGPCYEVLGAPGFERILEEISAQYTRVSVEPAPRPAPKRPAASPKPKPKPQPQPKPSGPSASEPGAQTPPPGPTMPPGMEDFDPMSLLGQLFDDSGNIKKRFKPFLSMAMKNAPSILKKMPPGMFPKVDGFDPASLEGLDFSQMSAEQMEAQMREFYERMQSGEDPFGGNSSGGKPPEKGE